MIKAPSILTWDPPEQAKSTRRHRKIGDTDLLGLREGLERLSQCRGKATKKEV